MTIDDKRHNKYRLEKFYHYSDCPGCIVVMEKSEIFKLLRLPSYGNHHRWLKVKKIISDE